MLSVNYSLFKALVFAVTLFGYSAVSFLVTDEALSRTITIPYRAIVLIFSIFIIIYESKLLNIRSSFKTGYVQSIRMKGRFRGIAVFALLCFVLFYSFALAFDVFNAKFTLFRLSSDYLLQWFGICLLPALSLLYLEKEKSNYYLIFSFLLVITTCLLVLRIDFSQSILFEYQGRVAGAALNPISLGHAGVTLTLLSIHLFLNKSGKKTFSPFLFLASAALGILVSFLAASRGPLISLAVCTSIVLISSISKRKNGIRLILLIIFASLAINQISSIVII